MAYTGIQFDRDLSVKIDRAYARYWDSTKRNVLIKEAIEKIINLNIVKNSTVLIQDELFGIYKTNQSFSPSSNTISLVTGISDYYHIMNLRCGFAVPVGVSVGSSVYIVEATQSTPVRIRLSVNSNLRTGSRVLIAGVTINTNANGVRYLKRVSGKWYELYSDENFAIPIIGNGTYTGTTGRITASVLNNAKNLKTNRKFSILNKADTNNPFYEIASGNLVIYPLAVPCTLVELDYISTPSYIDVSDGSTDLLLTYSQRFIYRVMDETAKLMGMASHDDAMIQMSVNEINQP